MTRTVRAATAAFAMLGGMAAVGCHAADRPGLQARFQNLNGNNSWPERYGCLARQSVLHPFEVQMHNAAVLDAVINNLDFDSGTDRLNGVGRDKLDRLARKMPVPQSKVYVQTASDVPYDPTNPQAVVVARSELDQKRTQAVLAYLGTRPSTRGVAFEVTVLDIADPGVNAAGPAASVRGLTNQYRSTLQGAVGGQLQGVGGGLATSTIGVAPTVGQPTAPTTGGNGPIR